MQRIMGRCVGEGGKLPYVRSRGTEVSVFCIRIKQVGYKGQDKGSHTHRHTYTHTAPTYKWMHANAKHAHKRTKGAHRR